MFPNMLNPTIGKILDLTGAPPYLLRPGETAFKRYDKAVAFPLNILTEEGFYRVTILGDITATNVNGNGTTLSPNDVAPAASTIKVIEMDRGVTGGFASSGSTASIISLAPGGRIDKSSIEISTQTKSKTIWVNTLSIIGSDYYLGIYTHRITDTTTPWTSLGIITFPFAQNGTIIIERII